MNPFSEAIRDRNGIADEWLTAMRAGDFARAWDITDRDIAAIRRSGPSKHQGPRQKQRIWRGEPLEGKRILVRCYHGLGDTIQFARFLPQLRRLATELTVWCQPELLSLMASVKGVDCVLPLHDGAPDSAFDVDIEIMEIPHAVRASRKQIEMAEPYLTVVTQRRIAKRSRHERFSIGLAWDTGNWDRRRVIPSQMLGTLNQPAVQLYSLQRGPNASAEAAEIGAVDISTPDIVTLAERLQRMDLCICPDTMIAHLSAALGCETWIMLHANCDWRWPASGRDTLWYPTARLFHQTVPGNWNDVLVNVRAAILERVELNKPIEGNCQRNGSCDVPADKLEAGER